MKLSKQPARNLGRNGGMKVDTNKEILRRAAFALKNGTVPGDGVEYFCTGREAQMEEINRCFQFAKNGGSTVKFICGEYGAGKTFLLKRAKIEAEKQGFITASVKINQGLRLNMLNHLYYHIMHNLSLQQRGDLKAGFEDLFSEKISWLKRCTEYEREAWIRDILRICGKYNETFARTFGEYIRAAVRKEEHKTRGIVSWITGEENISYEVKTSFRVTGNVDRLNAMDFLKAFAALIRLMGYAGLVILVDELELAMDERIDLRKKAYENLRYILDECALGQPESTVFIFAATEEILTDQVKGIPSYQALCQRLGSPADKKNSSLSDIKQPLMYLPPFHYENLKELSAKMICMHKELYECRFRISDNSIMNWALLLYKEKEGNLEKVNVRKYVMKLAEVLDIMEQHPENPMFRTELDLVRANGMITFRNARASAI